MPHKVIQTIPKMRRQWISLIEKHHTHKNPLRKKWFDLEINFCSVFFFRAMRYMVRVFKKCMFNVHVHCTRVTRIFQKSRKVEIVLWLYVLTFPHFSVGNWPRCEQSCWSEWKTIESDVLFVCMCVCSLSSFCCCKKKFCAQGTWNAAS